MKVGKVIVKVVEALAFVGSVAGVAYLGNKALKKETELKERYKSYYMLTNQWLLNRNAGRSIEEYFSQNDIESIAIYGMGTLGELFYQEVKKTNVTVKAFIDRNADEIYYGLDNLAIVNLERLNEIEKVDAIVVTPVFDFDDINEEIRNSGTSCKVISLEDIIYDIV